MYEFLMHAYLIKLIIQKVSPKGFEYDVIIFNFMNNLCIVMSYICILENVFNKRNRHLLEARIR